MACRLMDLPHLQIGALTVSQNDRLSLMIKRSFGVRWCGLILHMAVIGYEVWGWRRPLRQV